MAVSDEFRENWLECQEEYGKNIEAGDIPVLELDRIDESISLPAVKFTAPFDPSIDNQFDSYVHVPMATFKKPIDDLAAQVSQATNDLVDLKQRTEQARQDAIAATDEASNVDADLTGMTVTITNRNGVSKEVNIGFEILERNVYPSIAAMRVLYDRHHRPHLARERAALEPQLVAVDERAPLHIPQRPRPGSHIGLRRLAGELQASDRGRPHPRRAGPRDRRQRPRDRHHRPPDGHARPPDRHARPSDGHARPQHIGTSRPSTPTRRSGRPTSRTPRKTASPP